MADSKVKVTFYGGAGNVTGANFLLEEVGGVRILLDCGLMQGGKDYDEINWGDFPYDPASIDYLIISHAHKIGRAHV